MKDNRTTIQKTSDTVGEILTSMLKDKITKETITTLQPDNKYKNKMFRRPKVSLTKLIMYSGKPYYEGEDQQRVQLLNTLREMMSHEWSPTDNKYTVHAFYQNYADKIIKLLDK